MPQRRQVVLYLNRPHAPPHERASQLAIAERLAALLGWPFAGEYDPGCRYELPLYFVPAATLLGAAQAATLGIHDARDLFGGVVPAPFVATKAITHSLLATSAYSPEGWSPAFTDLVRESVLEGFSVFTLADAEAAGQLLLRQGPLRIKPVRATAGRGQLLVENLAGLKAGLAAQNPDEVAEYGLVLEEHLQAVITYSVGQVQIAERSITYYGTQSLTQDNTGLWVYGGSDLVIARGGFAQLLVLTLPKAARLAVAQAQIYDAAAQSCFDGFFASRRNYDIAQGLAADGTTRSGVLEQSWRIGGATSAEIAALQAFDSDPDLPAVRASSIELHGAAQRLPPNAEVIFQGDDSEVGFISKLVRIEPYGNA